MTTHASSRNCNNKVINCFDADINNKIILHHIRNSICAEETLMSSPTSLRSFHYPRASPMTSAAAAAALMLLEPPDRKRKWIQHQQLFEYQRQCLNEEHINRTIINNKAMIMMQAHHRPHPIQKDRYQQYQFQHSTSQPRSMLNYNHYDEVEWDQEPQLDVQRYTKRIRQGMVSVDLLKSDCKFSYGEQMNLDERINTRSNKCMEQKILSHCQLQHNSRNNIMNDNSFNDRLQLSAPVQRQELHSSNIGSNNFNYNIQLSQREASNRVRNIEAPPLHDFTTTQCLSQSSSSSSWIQHQRNEEILMFTSTYAVATTATDNKDRISPRHHQIVGFQATPSNSFLSDEACATDRKYQAHTGISIKKSDIECKREPSLDNPAVTATTTVDPVNTKTDTSVVAASAASSTGSMADKTRNDFSTADIATGTIGDLKKLAVKARKGGNILAKKKFNIRKLERIDGSGCTPKNPLVGKMKKNWKKKVTTASNSVVDYSQKTSSNSENSSTVGANNNSSSTSSSQSPPPLPMVQIRTRPTFRELRQASRMETLELLKAARAKLDENQMRKLDALSLLDANQVNEAIQLINLPAFPESWPKNYIQDYGCATVNKEVEATTLGPSRASRVSTKREFVEADTPTCSLTSLKYEHLDAGNSTIAVVKKEDGIQERNEEKEVCLVTTMVAAKTDTVKIAFKKEQSSTDCEEPYDEELIRCNSAQAPCTLSDNEKRKNCSECGTSVMVVSPIKKDGFYGTVDDNVIPAPHSHKHCKHREPSSSVSTPGKEPPEPTPRAQVVSPETTFNK